METTGLKTSLITLSLLFSMELLGPLLALSKPLQKPKSLAEFKISRMAKKKKIKNLEKLLSS
jgi:hypothetical protein